LLALKQKAMEEFQKWFGTVDQKGHESNVQVKTDIVVSPTVGTIVDHAAGAAPLKKLDRISTGISKTIANNSI